MKKYAIVLFSAILASCFAASAQQLNLNANIVTNPGFENGTATWSVETARITSAEAHSGKNSLEYTNTNPDSYKLIRQGVQSKPGQVLHFSAWVKGKDINTKNLWAVKGAGIMLQGYNAKGTLVSTSTPFTLTGTFDWKQVEGIYMVPNDVSKVMVCLYFRQKTFGTAWFDDISVQPGSSLSINGNIQSLAANIKSNLLSKLSSVNISSNTSTVDKQGFTLVNGSRFFPIGIYLAKGYGNGDWASTDDNLARISKAGFNTILDYMYGDRAPGAYLSEDQ